MLIPQAKGVIFQTEDTDRDLWLEAPDTTPDQEPFLRLCLARTGTTVTRNLIELETTQVEELMLTCAAWLHRHRLPRT
jgi:hypothetical protein